MATSSKLESYTKLKNRFLDLCSKIEAAQSDEVTAASVQALKDERIQIEKEEPSISDWLNKICFNETVDALGLDESAKRPIRWYYYLGNLKLT